MPGVRTRPACMGPDGKGVSVMDAQTFTEAAETAREHIWHAIESILEMCILAGESPYGLALRDTVGELDTLSNALTVYANEGLGME